MTRRQGGGPGAAVERMCRLAGVSRGAYYRGWGRSAPGREETALRDAIQRLALAQRWYGYRRITALLKREGWCVNHKRVARIWCHEGLKVPEKQPTPVRWWLNDGSCVCCRSQHQHHVWSYKFVMNRTHDGRAFRM